MSELTHRAQPKKQELVKKIVGLLNDYPIIGAVNMENLPTAQLQRMKAQLRDRIVLLMTKKRLILRAIDEVKDKKNIAELKNYLKAMPALLFTKENPFGLFRTLKKSKSQAPAKQGSIAPRDLVIPAGATPFAPGPIIGELGQLGIKAGVEGGKVAIKQDALVCEEGEVINEKVASLLLRLGIEPMEVGLDLVAVYENGTIYPKSVLDIDEEAFIQNLIGAAQGAYNIAIEITYTTKDTIELLLGTAFREAKALALEANLLSEETVTEILAKAEAEMISLKEVAALVEGAGAEATESISELKQEPVVQQKKEPIEVLEKKESEKSVEHKPEPIKKVAEVREEKVEQLNQEGRQEIKAPEAVMEEVKVDETAQEKQIKEHEPAEEVKADKIKDAEEKKEPGIKLKEVKEIKQAEEIFDQLKKKAAETGEPVRERIIKPTEETKQTEIEPVKAEDMLKPVDEIIKKEEKKREDIKRGIEEEKDEVKKAEKIFEQLQKRAAVTGRPVSERIIPDVKEPIDPENAKQEKEEKEKREQEVVEELTKELVKRGTLRKDKRRGV